MDKIQIYSIAGSLLFLLFILRLIKRQKLKEEYSILWLFVVSIFLLLSIFRSVLEQFADLVGIHYAPAALLLFLLIDVVAILIHYSVIISKLSGQNKVLIQEVALLKQKVSEMEKGEKNE
jgi:hypothetical protein